MRMIERLSERWETEERVGGAKGRAVRTDRFQVNYAVVIGRDCPGENDVTHRTFLIGSGTWAVVRL